MRKPALLPKTMAKVFRGVSRTSEMTKTPTKAATHKATTPRSATGVAKASRSRARQGLKPRPVQGPIEHVVIIVKENHTFDNYFGASPGVHGQALPPAGDPIPDPLYDASPWNVSSTTFDVDAHAGNLPDVAWLYAPDGCPNIPMTGRASPWSAQVSLGRPTGSARSIYR